MLQIILHLPLIDAFVAPRGVVPGLSGWRTVTDHTAADGRHRASTTRPGVLTAASGLRRSRPEVIGAPRFTQYPMRLWQRFTVLALLLSSVSCAAPGMRHSPAAERQSVPQPFELVAPTAEDSMMAHEQLRYGVSRFEALVGPVPAKLRVLLFDTEEDIQAHSARKLAVDHDTLLVWLTPVGDLLPFARLPGLGGAVLRAGTGGVPTVAGFAQRDTAFPVHFAQGDEIIALNGRATPNVHRLGAALALLPGGSRVALTVRRAGQVQEHAFVKAPTAVWSDYAVSHEAGHAYVAQYARSRRPGGLRAPVDTGSTGTAREGGSYGSPYLPDWLDEAVPKLMENPNSAQQAERRAKLAQNPARIPLRTFLSMDHPTIAVRRQAPRDTVGIPSAMLEGDLGVLTTTYYDQAAVFGEFLISRGEDRILGRLVDAFANGATLTGVLGKVPGLPRTLEQLDAEWLAWLNRGGTR